MPCGFVFFYSIFWLYAKQTNYFGVYSNGTKSGRPSTKCKDWGYGFYYYSLRQYIPFFGLCFFFAVALFYYPDITLPTKILSEA